MDYLLHHTMKIADGATDPSDAAQAEAELKQFNEACRMQAFHSGSNEAASFLIQRYQSDLEFFLLQPSDPKHLIEPAQNALYHLYTAYYDHCAKDHRVPKFFAERIRQEMQLEQKASAKGHRSFDIVIAGAEELKNESWSLTQLMQFCRGKINVDTTGEEIQQVQLQLGITVAQLGVLLHLFYAQNFFPGSSKIEVIKFFASHFTTGKQAHISQESLYGKFFKTEMHDLDIIKEKLIAMVNVINQLANKH
jgi:hypothetical protein